MKKTTYLIIMGALAPCLHLFAQQQPEVKVLNDEVRIENASVSRSDDNNLNIRMDLVLTPEMKVRSNKAAILTPLLTIEDQNKLLPDVLVYGRRRLVVNQRNRTIPADAYEVVKRKQGEEQRIPYLVQIPFEAWMKNAKLVLDADLCGCGNQVEANQLDPICQLNIRPDKLKPAIAYIAPQAEEVKVRSIEGSAFVDFRVSRMNIDPAYRRNTAELGKILATIDTVRLDPNVTLTGMTLTGYASPEGGYRNNARLAKGRTEALLKYVKKEYDFSDDILQMSSVPEDWEGFRRFIAASDMEQKEEILQIIDLKEDDMDAKEHRIARLIGAQNYNYLLTECYPALRHSDYKVVFSVRGFTVDETRDLIHTRPQQLSLQEIFNLAQTYEPGSEEFNECFRVAVAMFPDDPVANLNAAAMEIQRGGDLSAAKKYLDKADPKAGATLNNRGIIAMQEADWDTAERFFNEALQTEAKPQAEKNLKELGKQRNFPR